MNDDKNKIQFMWKIGEDKLINEEFNLQNFKNKLLEDGSIAEEISLACMAIQKNRNSRLFQFEPIKLLDNIKEDPHLFPFESSLKNFIQNYSDNKLRLKKEIDKVCFNFHILECIAIKFVESECEIALNNDSDNVICINEDNNIIMKKLNEIFILSISNRHINKDFGLMKFKELIEKIKQNNNISNNYIDFSTKKRKCIALYRKRRSKEITIAFSGFKDSKCNAIKNFIGVTNSCLFHYEEIAKAIGANLAKSTCSVSRYRFNNQAERYLSLKEIIDNNFSRNNERHSCCERKIFAYLEDRDEKVYSGRLFVKYQPCEECRAAIFYHILDKGKEFSMKVGLPNL